MKAVEIELEEMAQIHQLAEHNFRVVEHIYTKIQNPSPFFDFTANMLWRVMVIETMKFFSNKEIYNLNKYLNHFRENGKYYNEFPIGKDSIKEKKQKLSKHDQIVNNFREQRTHLYAHHSIEAEHFYNKTSIEEARNLLKVIFDTIQFLHELTNNFTIFPLVIETTDNNHINMCPYTDDLKKILRDLGMAKIAWNDIEANLDNQCQCPTCKEVYNAVKNNTPSVIEIGYSVK